VDLSVGHSDLEAPERDPIVYLIGAVDSDDLDLSRTAAEQQRHHQSDSPRVHDGPHISGARSQQPGAADGEVTSSSL
jgi:hypothetical protein